jgi:TRAP-type C4-dicarboxylate transport system permease small subunit
MTGLLGLIDKVAAGCGFLGRLCGGAGVALMTALITVDVVGRFAFGLPTYVATEFSGYLCVIITFAGLSHVSRTGRQIEVTILLGRLPAGLQRRIRFVTQTLALLFCAYFTWETADPAILDFKLGARSLTFVHTPLWLISGFVPLGLAMLTLELLAQWLKMVLGRRAAPGQPDLPAGEF